MADKFRALLVTKDGNRQSVAVTELTDADLMEGDVTVAVEHSTVNYKDGLAITGKAPIIRKFPLIPGIDLAGKVLERTSTATITINVQEREMVQSLDNFVRQCGRQSGRVPVSVRAAHRGLRGLLTTPMIQPVFETNLKQQVPQRGRRT